MKIQFDIEEKDIPVLIQSLEFAASRAINQKTFEALQKVIREVKDDTVNGVEIFDELKARLTPFTDGSAINLTSNFKTHLGISRVFLESAEGLISMLNQILRRVVSLKKPGVSPVLIKQSALGSASFIEDLVKLIIDNYEASN
jgi:hypothetical protein